MDRLSRTDSLSKRFGEKHKLCRRVSSTDWEIPSGDLMGFAKIKDTEEGFVARIDVSAFGPTFKPEDVKVDVYGYDLQIHAEAGPGPDGQMRQMQRQYRMPDNVDLSTVVMKRNRNNNVVRVDAKKIEGYGAKAVKFNVFDVAKGHDAMSPVKL
ncbi:hypothetical protein L596_013140 [Steinernema carpocapsae]|uniref:SHSP domain-containing protein n=1 Tax=Steinernema carpocapsae TaxID=34508 RepID=A0A4V6A519_STECR|nr:hypothetical protein L596_013140 [Steinernema carpocapsae]